MENQIDILHFVSHFMRVDIFPSKVTAVISGSRCGSLTCYDVSESPDGRRSQPPHDQTWTHAATPRYTAFLRLLQVCDVCDVCMIAQGCI
jgi:hypothetical protein